MQRSRARGSTNIRALFLATVRGRTARVATMLAVTASAWSWGVAGASAQMFGARRPTSFGASATTSDTTSAGQVRGNERFLRENRRTGAFIGNDPRQRQGFVGHQTLTTGRVRAAAEMARVLVAAEVNREAASSINRATGMYEPRLSVAFDVQRPSDAQITEDTVLQLQLIRAFPSATRIEVSVAAGIATLRGAVSSERDRTLAEQLVLFEPGIAGVRNELRVTSGPPSGSPPATTPTKPPKTQPKPPAKS